MIKQIRFRYFTAAGTFCYWGFIGDGFHGLTSCSRHPMTFEEIEQASERFTGLRDSKGKEIWEGDIVRLGSSNYEVKWLADAGQFCFWRPDDIGWNLLHSSECEVIGNIHQHPKLLEAKP